MQRLTRKDWLRIATAPIITIVAVVAAIIATDLATGGAHEPKPENQAALGPARSGLDPPPEDPPPSSQYAHADAQPPPPSPAPSWRPATRRGRTTLNGWRPPWRSTTTRRRSTRATGGNLQTVCIYKEIDADCKLKDFIDPIPTDPLGDPGRKRLLVRLRRQELHADRRDGAAGERDAPESCPEAAAKHTKKANLYCLSGSR